MKVAAGTYRHLCKRGDKERSILKAVGVRHPRRGDASLGMFTSPGQFLTAQLLVGDAPRRQGRKERGLGGLGAGGWDASC